MSFEIGQKVIHCRDGLSTIVSTTKMGEKEYFIVQIAHGQEVKTYVPIDRADAVIRHIMNKDEADFLLKDLKTLSKEFNPNTKQRRDAFKRRLSSGSVTDIAYMFQQNYLYKQDPDSVKLGAMDIEMLDYASNMLLDELALTYGIDREKILAFVIDRQAKL